MALDDNPIKGHFPTGDSRNITLTKGSNALEPDRTGPMETTYRDGDAANASDGSNSKRLGEQTPGELIASLTPNSGVMSDIVDKVRDVFGLDQGDDTSGDTNTQVKTQVSTGTSAKPYTLQQEPEPSASDYAFGPKGGGRVEPVLQKDWNPAERNSDDLSR
ncbi:hypothetical protein INR77_02820 [Erythrobacter sp. SCSIO 43205]|uniref:hypothetical protein n=1 Tax=Erythrobacter sp. SCSIO 43205 TaxID=2779361 RepID=UPI001CA9C866|nr:hypothetical protein [Erythrobacter sp. SCSIO 43205]UAB78680.1 hypothetical protein INR77_02820 [Erythrobacter sp. SCSIO 43205]